MDSDTKKYIAIGTSVAVGSTFIFIKSLPSFSSRTNWKKLLSNLSQETKSSQS